MITRKDTMAPILRNLTICSLALALGACAHNSKNKQYAGVDGDFVLGTPLPDRIEGANFFGSSVTRNQYPPIYFGFDSYSVSQEEMPKVKSLAQAMKGFPNTVIIAGFTDERGTEEYNRGLGERRAQAVRSALIGMGADGARIQTVSFGKEMPADSGSGDAAWAKNRRTETGVVK